MPQGYGSSSEPSAPLFQTMPPQPLMVMQPVQPIQPAIIGIQPIVVAQPQAVEIQMQSAPVVAVVPPVTHTAAHSAPIVASRQLERVNIPKFWAKTANNNDVIYGNNYLAYALLVLGLMFWLFFPYIGLPLLIAAVVFWRSTFVLYEDGKKQFLVQAYLKKQVVPYDEVYDITVEAADGVKVYNEQGCYINLVTKSDKKIVVFGPLTQADAQTRAISMKQALADRILFVY